MPTGSTLSSSDPSSPPKRLYSDTMPKRLRIRRLLWELVYLFLFRPTPRFALEGWRRFLLRRFGAKIGHGSRVAPSCFVWAPWHLTMGNYVCLADGVDCYSQAEIVIEDYATVSQRSFLCTASHDVRSLARPLFSRPIVIRAHAWICAEAFVGPGATIGEGAIVGARAAVFRDVADWTVVGGNPAREIGRRVLDEGATANRVADEEAVR